MPRTTIIPGSTTFSAGLVVLLTVALVLLPRPTQSRILPLPAVDLELLAEAEAREAKRASSARREPLPHSVRLLGEHLRRFGAAIGSRGPSPPIPLGYRLPLASQEQTHIRAEAAVLIEQGLADEILRLRALQGDLLVAAVHRYLETDRLDPDLLELGGDLYRLLRPTWGTSDPRQLRIDDDGLRVLARVRFGMFTGTHRVEPFGPSLNELRKYYSLLIQTPPREQVVPERELDMQRLAAIAALQRIDSDYPGALASALLYLRAGNAEAAAALLSPPPEDGPWAALSRNTLLSAHRASGP